MRPVSDLGISTFECTFNDLFLVKEYAEPYNKNAATYAKEIPRSTAAQALLNRRIEEKKQGIGRQRHPFVGKGLFSHFVIASFIKAFDSLHPDDCDD